MKFAEIIDDLAHWKKVRRSSWSEGIYFYMDHNTVDYYNPKLPDNGFVSLSRKDLLAEDWEVMDTEDDGNTLKTYFILDITGHGSLEVFNQMLKDGHEKKVVFLGGRTSWSDVQQYIENKLLTAVESMGGTEGHLKIKGSTKDFGPREINLHCENYSLKLEKRNKALIEFFVLSFQREERQDAN